MRYRELETELHIVPATTDARLETEASLSKKIKQHMNAISIIWLNDWQTNHEEYILNNQTSAIKSTYLPPPNRAQYPFTPPMHKKSKNKFGSNGYPRKIKKRKLTFAQNFFQACMNPNNSDLILIKKFEKARYHILKAWSWRPLTTNETTLIESSLKTIIDLRSKYPHEILIPEEMEPRIWEALYLRSLISSEKIKKSSEYFFHKMNETANPQYVEVLETLISVTNQNILRGEQEAIDKFDETLKKLMDSAEHNTKEKNTLSLALEECSISFEKFIGATPEDGVICPIDINIKTLNNRLVLTESGTIYSKEGIEAWIEFHENQGKEILLDPMHKTPMDPNNFETWENNIHMQKLKTITYLKFTNPAFLQQIDSQWFSEDKLRLLISLPKSLFNDVFVKMLNENINQLNSIEEIKTKILDKYISIKPLKHLHDEQESPVEEDTRLFF